MSLLLDALHRASKDKEKAALAAANAAAGESLNEGKLVLSAPAAKVVDFPDLVPIASTVDTLAPQMSAEDAVAVSPPKLPETGAVSMPVTFAQAKSKELALEIELEASPVPTLPVQAVVKAPSAVIEAPAVESYAATAKMAGVAASRRSDPQAAAAAIQNAYAAPVFTRAKTPNRRPAVLAGIAAVLGLAFASFALGLWGDPEKLLAHGNTSALTPVVAVPVPQVQLEPAASVSEAVAIDQKAPKAADAPVPSAQSANAPAPLPQMMASAAPAAAAKMAGVPSPKKATVQPDELVLRATPVTPIFSARARTQTALEVGYAALLSGRFDDASRAYAAALDANPGEPDALLGMAYMAHTKGQRDEAQSYYRRVLRQDPGNSVANAGLAALEVAANGASGGGAAGERAKELAARQPDSAAVQALAASTLVQEGALPDAALAFARAQALEPANPLHAYNLAVALDKLGNYAQAAAQYDKALRVNAVASAPLGAPQASAARLRASQLRQALGLSQEASP